MFYDQLILNDDVSLEDADLLSLVENWQDGMYLEFYFRIAKFNCQGLPIKRFDEPAAQGAMDLHSQSYDLPGQNHMWRIILSRPVHS